MNQNSTPRNSTEASNTEQHDIAEIIVRNPGRDRHRPKHRFPYLRVRNGRLTLIINESMSLPSLTPFS
ncbi:MAG: hypothetical protein M2R45_01542 [Verrucomicrobia subdivision 3 bacterium]|nr:hypothetical protein [Limisphaerales bacterium]MCS1413330.1 hypothetical protein [Limisphaerales bacterium]